MQCQMLGPIYTPKTYPPPKKKKNKGRNQKLYTLGPDRMDIYGEG